jgi:hypothetical protein
VGFFFVLVAEALVAAPKARGRYFFLILLMGVGVETVIDQTTSTLALLQ